jgi:hypothetical protein
MAIYVVGYDIHPKVGETYGELVKTLESFGTYWHCLDSTWLIKSELSADQVRNKLWAHMRADDQLLVVTYSRPSAWNGFTGDCHSWLDKNL